MERADALVDARGRERFGPPFGEQQPPGLTDRLREAPRAVLAQLSARSFFRHGDGSSAGSTWEAARNVAMCSAPSYRRLAALPKEDGPIGNQPMAPSLSDAASAAGDAHGSPPCGLFEISTLVTPDTLLRWYRRLIAKKCDVTKGLGDADFLVANQFSIADIATTSPFVSFRVAGAELDGERWPALARYVDRVFAQPAYASIVEADPAACG
jgi:hypothetical protein